MTTCSLERRGRHHAQRRLPKRILQIMCRWMLTPCTVKVARGRKARVKARTKGGRNRHDGKGEGKQPLKQRHFDVYCNQRGEYGHKKPDCASKSKFFNGTSDKCGAHGHERVDCPVKTVAHLESESVIEPNEEPTGIESLEWLYALEHDGETMASLTDAPVRLLPDSGSGVSACSPEFAPHVKTLTGSSVRTLSNRSGDQEPGQEDCELRHQRDRSRCEHGSAEALEANRVGRQDGAFRAQGRSG